MIEKAVDGIEEKHEIINKTLKCGIIMPISECDTCPASHWQDVKQIIIEAVKSITDYDVTIKLVSEADETRVIHKTIIENLYFNDVVICDISGKNPNVMLELGLRLAFDKPTVIIKDQDTIPAFDSSVIEYVKYPRSLHYLEIQDFQENLALKVLRTFEIAKKDPKYSTFLKQFGDFEVVSLEKNEITPEKYIIDTLQDLKVEIKQLKFLIKEENLFDKKISIRDVDSVGSLGKTMIKELILTFKLKHPNLDLFKSFNQINTIIEEKIDPSKYFRNYGEYEEYVKQTIKEIS